MQKNIDHVILKFIALNVFPFRRNGKSYNKKMNIMLEGNALNKPENY